MAELRITTTHDASIEQDRQKETKTHVLEALVAEIKACELTMNDTKRGDNQFMSDDSCVEKKNHLANLRRRLTAIAPNHALANPVVAIYASRQVNDAPEQSHIVPFVSFSSKEEINRKQGAQSARSQKKKSFTINPALPNDHNQHPHSIG